MREPLGQGINIPCIRQEAGTCTADAINILLQRVMAGLGPDGTLQRDVKCDWAVQRCDGVRVTFGSMADGFNIGSGVGEGDSWASLGTSADISAGSTYTCTAATFDDLYYIGLKDGSSEGIFETHLIAAGVPQAAILGSLTSAKLDAPGSQHIVMHPAGTKCAVICNDAGDGGQTKLQIIDLSAITAPVIVGELDLADEPGEGTQALWDNVRDVIYWPGKDATNHVFVFDVSSDTPTLASTYTTSSLTTVIACILSEDADYLYMSGNGGVESASIASTGTLTQDTLIANGNQFETLARNTKILCSMVKTSNSTVTVLTINWDSTDQGALTINTTNGVTGSYTNATKFRNCTMTGDYLASSTGVPGTAGLFLVFNTSDPAVVTEHFASALASLDSGSEVAMGGPAHRVYVQLGIGSDVETWSTDTLVEDILTFTANQLISTTTTLPPLSVQSQLLVENLNADLLDGQHANEISQAAVKTVTAELTSMSGATVTASSLVPAGSFILGVTVRVGTLIQGANSFDVGDGSDVNRWGASIAVAVDTVADITDFTADGFGQFTSANDVVLTAR